MKQVVKKSLAVFFSAAALTLLLSCGGSTGSDDQSANCGNGVCEKGEDIILLTDPVQFRCAQDCPGVCGDSVCNTCFENKDNCPQDCAE